MNKILDSTYDVVVKSKHVKINTAKIIEESKKIDLESSIKSYNNHESFMELSKYDTTTKLDLIFLFNSINFCYWGNPKWNVEINENKFDGAKGLIELLKEKYDSVELSLNSDDLAKYSINKVLNLLKGNDYTRLPLINKRKKIINEIGTVLSEKYSGDIRNLIFRSELNANKLLEIITKDFPSYDDYSMWNNKKIYFHKRAQLAISEFYKNTGMNIEGIDDLTAFADYKIPQGLRKMDIISYSDELSHKIDSKIRIEKDSTEEIELRANSIWAIEFMKDELKNNYPTINSPIIDYYIWTVTQKKSPNDKPYHLTLTTAY